MADPQDCQRRNPLVRRPGRRQPQRPTAGADNNRNKRRRPSLPNEPPLRRRKPPSIPSANTLLQDYDALLNSARNQLPANWDSLLAQAQTSLVYNQRTLLTHASNRLTDIAKDIAPATDGQNNNSSTQDMPNTQRHALTAILTRLIPGYVHAISVTDRYDIDTYQQLAAREQTLRANKLYGVAPRVQERLVKLIEYCTHSATTNPDSLLKDLRVDDFDEWINLQEHNYDDEDDKDDACAQPPRNLSPPTNSQIMSTMSTLLPEVDRLLEPNCPHPKPPAVSVRSITLGMITTAVIMNYFADSWNRLYERTGEPGEERVPWVLDARIIRLIVDRLDTMDPNLVEDIVYATTDQPLMLALFSMMSRSLRL